MSSTATLPKAKAIKPVSTAAAIAAAELDVTKAVKANIADVANARENIQIAQRCLDDSELAFEQMEADCASGDAKPSGAAFMAAKGEVEIASLSFAGATKTLALKAAKPANTSKALALIALHWVGVALNDGDIPLHATFAKMSAIGSPDSIPSAFVVQSETEKAQGGAMSGVFAVALHRKGRHSRLDGVAIQKAAQANGCDVEVTVHTQDDGNGNYVDRAHCNVRWASAAEPVIAADPAESAADRFSQGFAAELADRTKSSTDGPVRFNPSARVYSSVTTAISDVSGSLVSVKTDAEGSRIATVKVSLTHRSTNIRAAGVPVGTHVAQLLAGTVGTFRQSLGRCMSADVVATEARPSTDGDASRMSTTCTMELAFQSLAA